MTVQPLAAAPCPACSAAVNQTDTVCARCGSPLEVAQRRIVTVLFTDLVGYTRLCSELDVEEVHLLVRPLMNGLRAICEELGGNVAAIEGDGFMAVFGARRSDPDDPRRATAAAAAMQRRVHERRQSYGSGLAGLRVGLHVGEVLVAPSWEQTGYSVSGDVVNVASRLCTAAQPSEVLASAEVQAMVPDLEWTDPRALHVRNRAEEVLAVSLPWAAAAPVPTATRPPMAPLLGRSEELAWLDAAPSAPVVQLHGEPGVGKTRLLQEWAAARGPDVAWLRCASFDLDSGRAALRALLPAAAGREVQADTVADPLELAAQAADVLRSSGRTLVVDDGQWAVEAVQDLVRALAAEPGGARVIVLSREPLAWLTGSPVRELAPLGEKEVRALVDELLPRCPTSVATTLVERSGGLPLFVEQCVVMLLDDGTLEVRDGSCVLARPAGLTSIPTAMRLFVSARLDHLAEAARRVLLTAAVLGDEVEPGLLLALHPDADDAVGELVERGLVRKGPDGRVRFAHALVRDVAYASQLKRARRDIHCAAADWFGILPAREMLEARAKHLRAAVDLGQPDCALAADAALALSAWATSIVEERPAAAVQVVEEVFALAEAMPQCDLPLLQAHLCAATGYERVGRETEAARHAQLAAPLAARLDDGRATADAALLEGRALVLEDPSAAESRLAAAVAAYRAAGDIAGVARAQVARAFALEASEGSAPVRQAHEDAYRAGIRTGDNRLVAHSAQQLAFIHGLFSRSESEEWVRRAETATRSDDEAGTALVQLADALCLMAGYDYGSGAMAARRAMESARASGSDYVLRNALAVALECALQTGDLDLAESLSENLVEVAGRRPNDLQRQITETYSAFLHARRGRPDDADEQLRRAQSTAAGQERSFRRFTAAVGAQIMLERGRFAQAEQLAIEARDLDVVLQQPLYGVGSRYLLLRAQSAAGRRVTLHESLALPREALERGAPVLASLVRLTLVQDDALRRETATEPPAEVGDLAEARALQLETRALRERRPELLLEAAREWSTLGATIWPARALTWHTALTGEEHPEVADMVARVGADPAVIGFFAGQVS